MTKYHVECDVMSVMEELPWVCSRTPLGDGKWILKLGPNGAWGTVVIDEAGRVVSGSYSIPTDAEPMLSSLYKSYVDTGYPTRIHGYMGVPLIQRRGLWSAVREYLSRVKQDLRAAFQANFSPMIAGILSASIEMYLAMEKLRSFWTIKLTDFVRAKRTEAGFQLDFSEIEAKINSSTRELLSAWFRRITSLFPFNATEKANVMMILELATPLRFTPEQRAAIKKEALEELAREKGVPEDLIPAIMTYQELDPEHQAQLREELRSHGLSESDIRTFIGYGSISTAEPPSGKTSDIVQSAIARGWPEELAKQLPSYRFMSPSRQQAFIAELRAAGIEDVDIEGLISAATFHRAQLSLPKIVEEHPVVYKGIVIGISEKDDTVTVEYVAKGYMQKTAELKLSQVRKLYPDVKVGDEIKIEISPDGPIPTEKYIAPGEAIREFAPLFGGTFTDYPSARPCSKFREWATHIAEEEGVDISKFTSDQESSWEELLTNLQRTYDMAAVLAWQKSNLRIKESWSRFRLYPLFGPRVLRWLPSSLEDPEQTMNEVQEKLRREIINWAAKLGQSIAVKDGNTVMITPANLKYWDAYAVSQIANRRDELLRRIRHSTKLSSLDDEIWADIISAYVHGDILNWLIMSMNKTRFSSTVDLMEKIDLKLIEFTNDRFKAAEAEETNLRLHTDWIDDFISAFNPMMNPHSRLYRPRLGKEIEHLVNYWEDSIKPGFVARLTEAIKDIPFESLPAVDDIMRTVRDVALLEFRDLSPNTLRWDEVMATKLPTPTTKQAWINNLVNKMGLMVREIPRVASTVQGPLGTRGAWKTVIDWRAWAHRLVNVMADTALEESGAVEVPLEEESAVQKGLRTVLQGAERVREATENIPIVRSISRAAEGALVGAERLPDYVGEWARSVADTPLGWLLSPLSSLRSTTHGWASFTTPASGEVIPIIESMITVPFLESAVEEGIITEEQAKMIVGNTNSLVYTLLRAEPGASKLLDAIEDPKSTLQDVGIAGEELVSWIEKNKSKILQDLGRLIKAPPPPPEPPQKTPTYYEAVQQWKIWIYGIWAHGDIPVSDIMKMDSGATIEAGWQAIKTTLMEALKKRYPDVPEHELDFFLESSREDIDQHLETLIQTFRVARDIAWDPEGTKHIKRPADVRRPYHPAIYRQPHRTAYPEEAVTVATAVIGDLAAFVQDLAAPYLSSSFPAEKPPPEAPGQLVIDESDIEHVSSMFTAWVRSAAHQFIHPIYPWATRIAVINRIVEKFKSSKLPELVSEGKTFVGKRYSPMHMESGDTVLPPVIQHWINEKITELSEWVKSQLGKYAEPPESLFELYSQPPPAEDWQGAETYLEETAKLLPPEAAWKPVPPETLERWKDEILDYWIDFLESQAVDGTNSRANEFRQYSRILDTQNWKLLSSNPQVQHKIAIAFEEAKKAFISQRGSLLEPLVRSVIYQIPFTSPDQVEAVKHTCFRLLTNEWENFFETWVEEHVPELKLASESGSQKFQAREPHEVMVYPALNFKELWDEIISQSWSEGGVIRELMNRYLAKVNDPSAAYQFASDMTWEMRRLYQEKIVDQKTEYTLEEYTALLQEVFSETLDTGLKKIESLVTAGQGPVDWSEIAEMIKSPDTPLTDKIHLFREAELHPSSPGVEQVLSLKHQLLSETGLPDSPLEIEKAMLGFMDRFSDASASVYGSGIMEGYLLSRGYIERLHTAYVRPLLSNGLIEVFSPEVQQAIRLIDTLYTNHLYWPETAADVPDVIDGFTYAARRVGDQRWLAPILALWPAVRQRCGELLTFLPEDMRTRIWDLPVTTLRVNQALCGIYTDKYGNTYTQEEALNMISDFPEMIRRHEFDKFIRLWNAYIVPFIESEKRCLYPIPAPGGVISGKAAEIWHLYQEELKKIERERRESGGGK